MASIKRERLFAEYRSRLDKAKEMSRKCFLMQIIPFGGSWVIFKLYNVFSGAGLFIGQMILYYSKDKNETDLRVYAAPLLLLYLFAAAVLSMLNYFTKKKGFNIALTVLHIISFIFGLYCLFSQKLDIVRSVLIMVQGFYGFWCTDIINRQYKEFKFLSKQDGYPEFNDVLGEPVPISNTRGVYLRQHELLKKESRRLLRKSKNNEEEPVEANTGDGCVDANEYIVKSELEQAMDEVNTDFGDSIEELLKKAK